MFCDQTKVRFIGGKGGDGAKSYRREKHVPRGGPSGGDGGHGGDVVLVADPNINTLFDFNRQKIFRAEEGERGGTKECHGAQGEDLILPVPCGTMVFDESHEKLLADLKNKGDSFVVASGGRGGKGNAHFKSSIRQLPQFAELGEPGEEKLSWMELKLVADVGIIGFPSVGKSTLISKISDAKPKIAEYHFTTLIPNLGVVNLQKWGGKKSETFVVADIPGLIEGAHLGKGLGHEFLRHISRTAGLVHLLDANDNDLLEKYRILNKELKAYDKNLAKKEQIVVINKIDTIDAELVEFLKDELVKANRKLKNKVLAISAVTGEGIKDLVFAMWKKLNQLKKTETLNVGTRRRLVPAEDHIVLRPHLEDEKSFEVTKRPRPRKEDGVKRQIFFVTGKRIQQIVAMTDFSNDEAVARVYDVMHKMGVENEVRRQGGKLGDIMVVKERELKFRG